MRRTSAFVGRDGERAWLAEQVRRPGSVSLVVGVAGIGKSRLIDEVVDADDLLVLRGVAWQSGTSTPYLPWIQIVRTASAISPPSDDALATDLAPLLTNVDLRSRFEEDEIARDLLAVGVTEFLRQVAAAADRPVVVLIEDAHAADAETVELAAWVANQHLDLALVVTSRPRSLTDDAPHESLASLESRASLVALGPLDVVAVGELLEAHEATDLNAVEIAKDSGGVPLQIHNLMEAQATRRLRPGQLVLDTRVDSLDERARDVLAFAALMGGTFELPVLAAVVGSEVPDVLESLSGPLESGLLERIEPSLTQFRFDHETARAQIDEGLGATDRASRHRRVLDTLLARGGAETHDLSTLAHHASYAAFGGDADLAVDLNLAAGHRALAQRSPSMALRHFERAVELAELAGSEADIRNEAELGALRALKADAAPEFRGRLSGFLERSMGDPAAADAFVDGVLLLPSNWSSLALSPEPDPATVVWLERALTAVGPEPTERRARVLIELSLHRRRGPEHTADELVREASLIAEQLGDRELEAYIYASVQWLARHPAEVDEVLERINRFEQSDLQLGGNEIFVLTGLRITTLFRVGAFGLARRELQRLESALAPLPPFVSWAIGRWRSTLSFVRGELDTSEQRALEAFEFARGASFEPVAFEYLAMQLAVVMRDRVVPEAAVDAITAMVSERPDYGAFRAAYAWVLFDLGRVDESRRELARIFARQQLRTDETAIEWMPLVTMSATVASELGEADWCRECVELLEPFKDEWIVWGTGIVVDGPVRLRRGYAALGAGDLETAADDFAVARRMIVGASARIYEPVLLHHEAQLAAAHGGVDRAIELLSEAADAAADLGNDTAAGMFVAAALQREVAHPSAADTKPREPVSGRHGTIVRAGAMWRFGLDDEEVSVAHVKGLLALVTLLERPGREVHALELSAVLDGTGVADAGPSESLDGPAVETDLLDERALAEYRSRITELQQDIDEADHNNDAERSARLHEEFDFLVEELQRSTGVGGKSRQTTGAAERARVRVTKSLRTAIGRVADASPRIGGHLENTINTGLFCAYEPDELTQIEWHIER